jgi:hypothetical protein
MLCHLPLDMLSVGLQVGDAGACTRSVFGTLRPVAITNREIPHDHGTQYHGTQSGQRRCGDVLAGITASGRRPARMVCACEIPRRRSFCAPWSAPRAHGHTGRYRPLWLPIRRQRPTSRYGGVICPAAWRAAYQCYGKYRRFARFRLWPTRPLAVAARWAFVTSRNVRFIARIVLYKCLRAYLIQWIFLIESTKRFIICCSAARDCCAPL